VRIGEVAAGAGVSVRALRYYEEQHLLYPERSTSGQRHYPEAAVERVKLIQHFYLAGLNSEAIHGLLPCLHTGVVTAEMMLRLNVERARMQQHAQALNDTLNRLDAIIATASDQQTSCAAGVTTSSG
jgi:DNA-binding transcriptional MerR regulator